jgi:PHD/YefM family antitoxin component YafN of YafNO toxin-antitoxin module
MSEKSLDDLVHTLRERGAHYVVDTQGQPIAVLLTLDEYEHYRDLLDDETDSQGEELAARLEQAAARPTGNERTPIRDYLAERESSLDEEVQS